MQSILVVGASGFTGRHLARRLSREPGVDLIGAARHAPAQPATSPWRKFHTLDIRDTTAVDDLIAAVRPQVVFHMAGAATAAESDVRSTIVGGTGNLLGALRRHAADCKLIHVGSAAEYGAVSADQLPVRETEPCHPVGAYGIAKYEATTAVLHEIERRGLKAVIARPFNIVGAGVPRTLVVGALIDRILNLQANADAATLRVGNLDTERDFVGVEDVVEAYVAIMRGQFWGEIINVCSGRPTSIRSIAEHLIRLAGRPVVIEVDPALVRPSDVPVSYGSWEKAHQLFGYVPSIDLFDALTSAWHAALEVRTSLHTL